MTHTQEDFSGGMNLLTADIQIANNAYRWLFNARQRLGFIEANRKHVEDSSIPAGKKQGIVGVGNVLIAFVSGLAYYKIDGTAAWIKIPSFSMDTVVDRYFTQAIPASSFNSLRKNNSVSANNPIVIDADFSINGTPAAILVQDTVNQPWIIIYEESSQTFVARVTHSYSEWTLTDHEYCPIGRQMIFKNGILFIVSRDGKSIYRSVTGRPLDFMVNVDVNGNKLPSEFNGGAASVSFSFDFEEITCLKDANAENVFIIGTRFNIRLIIIDYFRTIFGEPLFSQVAKIESGVVNQESLLDVLGDYIYVDFENIKSFNAVLQLKNEGRNSIFSLNLAGLLKDIKQKEPCACIFDNFALFYVKTIFGNLVAVYDTLHEKWTALDLTTVDRIKQFGFVDTVTETKLYAITYNDELFQLYASEERELAQLATRAITPFADVQHKSQAFKPLFRGGTSEGELSVVEFVDEIQSNRLTAELENVSSGIAYPVIPPVIPHTINSMNQDSLVFKDGLAGKKISFVVQWNNNARLHGFTFETSEIKRDAPLRQQANTIKNSYEP